MVMKYSTHISPTGWVVARTCSKITNPYLYRLDNMQAKKRRATVVKASGRRFFMVKIVKII
jgi:hypothetical protein